ncbi:MAG: hypothetical protein A2035_01990 [Nitrospirae bacterium GWA2_42_11]|nr:MAG: hypothetical protein A2035_01990 [Nitrospirae bacterium GWA2_42_11]
MVNEPADDPPWFLAVLERDKLPPRVTLVAAVDSADVMRSGVGTVTCVEEQRTLLFSLLSAMALPESALVQT